ncbi:hypothetical protein N9W62_03270 [Akkermansiaceae bacterium]|nr:hypothetical protein [Akkermansiaceae bacterium]
MNTHEYRKQLHLIHWLASNNEFHLFFTMRDIRPKSTYKRFCSTSADESGYLYRNRSAKGLIQTFKASYKIRGGRNRESEFHHLLIHEAGVGRSHFLNENCGHIHLAIGFKPSSRFYGNPTAHMDEFMARVQGGLGADSGRKWEGSHRWSDFCSSLANDNSNYLIQDSKKVAAYMAKPEYGTLNGGCFSKQPEFWSLPNQPTARDLFLPPLAAM